MFLRLNWLSGGICGRLEAYIGYKGDIKSKVVQLELFHRNLGRSHIMELLENEKKQALSVKMDPISIFSISDISRSESFCRL